MERHVFLEFLSMLLEIKEALEIDEDEILNEIDERKEALAKQKE
jgi:hypothetical protein